MQGSRGRNALGGRNRQNAAAECCLRGKGDGTEMEGGPCADEQTMHRGDQTAQDPSVKPTAAGEKLRILVLQ